MSNSAYNKLIWTGTIKAYGGQGNYLKVDDNGMLTATGTSAQDPACSFSIYENTKSDMEAFKSNSTGHYAGPVVDETNGYVIRVNVDFDSEPLQIGLTPAEWLKDGIVNYPVTTAAIIIFTYDNRVNPGQQALWQYLGAFAKYEIGVKPLTMDDLTFIYVIDPPLLFQ